MARQSDPQLAAAWREVVERFRESGLTQRQFCAEEGLSPSTLGYWLRKLGDPPRLGADDASPFLRLFETASTSSGPFGLVVELPGGVVLRFSGLSR